MRKALLAILACVALGHRPINNPFQETPPVLTQPAGLPLILNSEEAEEILCAALNFPKPDWIVGPEDSVYICPTQEEIADLLTFYKYRREGFPWTADSWDCDNASAECKVLSDIWSYKHYGGIRAALLTGKVYCHVQGNYSLLFPGAGNDYVEGWHVLNFIVRNDGKVFFWEPQSNLVASVESFIYDDAICPVRLEY